jgi:hypothetical protein
MIFRFSHGFPQKQTTLLRLIMYTLLMENDMLSSLKTHTMPLIKNNYRTRVGRYGPFQTMTSKITFKKPSKNSNAYADSEKTVNFQSIFIYHLLYIQLLTKGKKLWYLYENSKKYQFSL